MGSGRPETREVWLIDKTITESGQGSATYTGLAEHIRHTIRVDVSEIDRRIADNPYNPTIPEHIEKVLKADSSQAMDGESQNLF